MAQTTKNDLLNELGLKTIEGGISHSINKRYIQLCNVFYIFYPSKFPHGFINNCNCPRFYYSTDLRRAVPHSIYIKYIYSRPLMCHPAVEFGVLAMQNVSPLDTTRKHLRHLRELLKQCQ